MERHLHCWKMMHGTIIFPTKTNGAAAMHRTESFRPRHIRRDAVDHRVRVDLRRGAVSGRMTRAIKDPTKPVLCSSKSPMHATLHVASVTRTRKAIGSCRWMHSAGISATCLL